jgi:hypothetical protein
MLRSLDLRVVLLGAIALGIVTFDRSEAGHSATRKAEVAVSADPVVTGAICRAPEAARPVTTIAQPFRPC